MSILQIDNAINFRAAAERLKGIVTRTELQYNKRLSEKYQCRVFLKREDQQPVRSYKLRGAYNKIISSSREELRNGVVCASAGNHAQGVAYTCKLLGLKGVIFMPVNTPYQKIKRVDSVGASSIEIFLEGESYDECAKVAELYCIKNNCLYVPPFDDTRIIEGQGTVAIELLEDLPVIDYLFLPVGGGGLAAGAGSYFLENSPESILIGLEPAGAASMTAAFQAGKPVEIDKVDPFVDGAAVSKVGALTYEICRKSLSSIQTVPEGQICSTVLSLYNEDGIVTEPAGALAIAGLELFADEIKGKNVVCIISGSNNDSNRFEDIKKLADEWEGLQHYLIIRFHHHPCGVSEFFSSVIGNDNHVNRIEYNRRDHGRSTYGLVGVRSKCRESFLKLLMRLGNTGMQYREVNKEDFLFKYWV